MSARSNAFTGANSAAGFAGRFGVFPRSVSPTALNVKVGGDVVVVVVVVEVVDVVVVVAGTCA
jgi:hypothetical protein